jgi:hypothetical protein
LRYAVRAVSSGTPALESVDSPHASARADATAPVLPSAVLLANGAGQGNQWISLANRSSISISVTLPGTSLASDTVRIVLSNGAASVTKTAAAPGGGGTFVVGGIDALAVPDGTVSISVTVADAAGNVSAPRTSSAPKDTVAPAAPSATYVDERRAADGITGTAETGSLVTATQTVPVASGPYTATASGAGAYALVVARTDGTPGKPVTVTYLVTATDAAGNIGAAATLTAAATR